MGLQAANRDAGLQVLSLTGQWAEDTVEKAREEGAAMGIDHPIGYTAYFGEQTPYLNMNVGNNFSMGVNYNYNTQFNTGQTSHEFKATLRWSF